MPMSRLTGEPSRQPCSAPVWTCLAANGQRILAVELNAPAKGKFSGILVLPFGLALAKGASLQVDDKATGQSSRRREEH
ncbi:MAG: invasion associated locus B family protein [Sinorhizobium meliloti]|nr:invasion associated locus B family protein [Sinorhizobium meliloti]